MAVEQAATALNDRACGQGGWRIGGGGHPVAFRRLQARDAGGEPVRQEHVELVVVPDAAHHELEAAPEPGSSTVSGSPFRTRSGPCS
ncbi:MAG TPA: hypothetical protein VKS82_22170 [Streptosporangiaceae bacterium]|nr:hypothetical protein [Streptosporangiaceae bacterium]